MWGTWPVLTLSRILALKSFLARLTILFSVLGNLAIVRIDSRCSCAKEYLELQEVQSYAENVLTCLCYYAIITRVMFFFESRVLNRGNLVQKIGRGWHYSSRTQLRNIVKFLLPAALSCLKLSAPVCYRVKKSLIAETQSNAFHQN